jgi:hypothetical protein
VNQEQDLDHERIKYENLVEEVMNLLEAHDGFDIEVQARLVVDKVLEATK